jgi:2-hydroxychromene-2-carboxylate isomerase
MNIHVLVHPDVLRAIDEARGQVPRSKFVAGACMRDPDVIRAAKKHGLTLQHRNPAGPPKKERTEE